MAKRKQKDQRCDWPDYIACEDDRPRPFLDVTEEELDALIEEERKKLVPVEESPGRIWWDQRRAEASKERERR